MKKPKNTAKQRTGCGGTGGIVCSRCGLAASSSVPGRRCKRCGEPLPSGCETCGGCSIFSLLRRGG